MEFISKGFEKGNFRIHYQDGGSGTPILLLHGYGEDGNIWKTVADAFEGCKMIMPDFPGFGKSKVTEAYTLEEMMEVFFQILKQEGIHKFFVFGHSMGGYTASEFVHAVPDRLLGVGMIHSHPFGDTDEIKSNRKKREEHIASYGLDGFTKEFYPVLFGRAFASGHPDVVEEMRTTGMSLDPQAFIAGMHAMRMREDRSEAFKKFPEPVFFLVGDDDRAVPADMSLKQLSLPPIADVHIMEGIGHTSMLEAQDLFIQYAKSFIRTARALEKTTA